MACLAISYSLVDLSVNTNRVVKKANCINLYAIAGKRHRRARDNPLYANNRLKICLCTEI